MSAAANVRPAHLKRLFDRHDRLVAKARDVEREIAREGRTYWQQQGCLGVPRIERLREAAGAGK